MAVADLTGDPATIRDEASVVVFYAAWCGDCRRSLLYEKAMSAELEGKVAFYRMDAERFERIADLYGVERYPTYVFFRRGVPDKDLLAEPGSEEEVRGWIRRKMQKKPN